MLEHLFWLAENDNPFPAIAQKSDGRVGFEDMEWFINGGLFEDDGWSADSTERLSTPSTPTESVPSRYGIVPDWGLSCSVTNAGDGLWFAAPNGGRPTDRSMR